MKKLKLIFLITLFTLASNVNATRIPNDNHWNTLSYKPHLYHKSPTVFFSNLINCHNIIVKYNSVWGRNCSRILVEWMDSVNGEPNWSNFSQQAMYKNLGVSKKELLRAYETVARAYLKEAIKAFSKPKTHTVGYTIVYEQPMSIPSAGYYSGCLKKKITYNQCVILFNKYIQNQAVRKAKLAAKKKKEFIPKLPSKELKEKYPWIF